MTYVDTSVVLAWILQETTRPQQSFWTGNLTSSRLTEYEAWVRLHAYGLVASHGGALRATLMSLHLVEIDEAACARVFSPFPVTVRTLDALHLAAADHVRAQGASVEIATYDDRFRDAALSMGFPLAL